MQDAVSELSLIYYILYIIQFLILYQLEIFYVYTYSIYFIFYN